MYSLVFLALIGLAASAPQAILPYSMSMMPLTHITPYTAGIMPLHSGIMPYMTVASRDMYMKSMLPKPVEDTPEVKMAKEAFAAEYQKELMGRQKRDVAAVMPFSAMPYASYNMMPYTSHMVRPVYDNTHLLSTPFVAHI